MTTDIKLLRELANRYAKAANSPVNAENIARHKRVNSLRGDRPIVLIDEIPWHEMNIGDELTLRVSDPVLREAEWYFRYNLYKWKHMRADMVLTPYYGVQKLIGSTGIGFARREKEHEENALAHTYVDQITRDEDIDKLQNEHITYYKAETKAKYNVIADAIGDILPVKITGEATGYGLGCKTMDDIVNLRGLDSLFYDLIERPEFMHRLIGRLTDIFLDKIRQYNELGLFDGDAYYIHSTSALTDDLKPDYAHTTSDGVWGRGLAQIFASVSPEMHDEFDTEYMIRAMAPFGLIYYGCCEPLDKKLDIISRIPRLRKISITPWADIDAAAEIIGGRYVIASKPNPASVASGNLDCGAVKAELDRIVGAIRRNGCSADIVLKDISTVNGNPETLFRWHDIAMEAVNNF